jgi:hypothetical protein
MKRLLVREGVHDAHAGRKRGLYFQIGKAAMEAKAAPTAQRFSSTDDVLKL